jgi:uncharacterized protein (UPF0276 family)
MHAESTTQVGVGLRHEHYHDALEDIAPIDFVEVHAENFFSSGGAAKQLLKQATEHYSVSIHATSLGLGSVAPPSQNALSQLKTLCDDINPMLVSDHACFNRALVHGKQVHTGDLLPIRFNNESLSLLSNHVDLVQNTLSRTLLLENLSAYLPQQEESYTEFEFLTELCNRTGCKLLVDVNNLLVNAHNRQVLHSERVPIDPIEAVMADLSPLKGEFIGEYHLAGTTPAGPNEIMIDDHARPVSEQCWALYQAVMTKFGSKPTLIEWDQELPSWSDLVALAHRAKSIQQEVLS